MQIFSLYLGGADAGTFQISGYQIDSRLVAPGNVFFALPGENTDGHQFLGQAKEKGAIAAVVSKKYLGPDFGLLLLRVEDVVDSLQQVAKKFLEKFPVQIVGITGSVGKTTTKEFTATLLEGKYRVGKNVGSYNTKVSLPLTLLNRTGEEEILVLEMGMSAPGDIPRLLEIATPDVAVLTKVALAHAAFFPGGLEEIAREKMTIFSRPKTKIAIIDEALAGQLAGIHAEKLSFSLTNQKADYYLSGHFVDERGIRGCLVDLPFTEAHTLHDLLAAIAVARQMKMEWDEIKQRLPFLRRPPMRFEIFEQKGICFVNDAYNANPASMRAALSNLPKPKKGGKTIARLGTMKELGAFSADEHRELGFFAKEYLDHLLVLGEEAKPLCAAFQGEFFLDHQSMADRLKNLMQSGDVVLIKGSRSMKMETIVGLL